jgi:ribosomal protein S18 acetylase RimI-like enzyme
VEIRRADKDDLDDFVRVYVESYRGLEDYAYTRKRDVKNYFKWLLSRDKDGVMVAEIDGEAVGFVACDTNWFSIFERKKVGEIHELFVLPEFRGEGIGAKLMEKALEYALERNRKVAELWVGRTNYRARRFYASQGFEEAGEWGKWVRMRKVLVR